MGDVLSLRPSWPRRRGVGGAAVMSEGAAVPADRDREALCIQRCLAGEAGAFRELYEAHAGAVFDLCRRQLRSADAAADVSQEVFLRVFRHLPRFRGEAGLRTWIYRIAINCCRTWQTRQGRRDARMVTMESPAGVERDPVDPAAGPEERAASAEAAQRVEAALQRLPPRFREAVQLRDLAGLDYDSVAQVLGVPIGTARSRIARGRERLRQWLEEEQR